MWIEGSFVKLEDQAYIQGSFIELVIFCLQVEGPITQGAYKQDSLVYLIYTCTYLLLPS